MGLELAEFFLAIEDEFQVDIFGADFSYIQTLDDFITILEKETALAPHNQAQADRLFQEQFLVIQNFFAKELGVEHSQLTPETNTALLLRSLSSRRRIWKKMRKEISESIPPLYGKEYREWLGGISVFFAFVFGLILSIEWGVIASIFYGPFLFGILYETVSRKWVFFARRRRVRGGIQ